MERRNETPRHKTHTGKKLSGFTCPHRRGQVHKLNMLREQTPVELQDKSCRQSTSVWHSIPFCLVRLSRLSKNSLSFWVYSFIRHLPYLLIRGLTSMEIEKIGITIHPVHPNVSTFTPPREVAVHDRMIVPVVTWGQLIDRTSWTLVYHDMVIWLENKTNTTDDRSWATVTEKTKTVYSSCFQHTMLI